MVENIVKSLVIEIPVTNRSNNLINYLQPTIKNIAELSSVADIAINFNGNDITKEQKEGFIALLNSLSFTVYHKTHEYHFEPGKASILKVRRDTHLISPHYKDYKYILRLDDDMELLPGYDKDIIAALDYLKDKPQIGTISIQKFGATQTIMPISPIKTVWQMGGIILRNMPEWNFELVPDRVKDLYGSTEDLLNCFTRLEEGYELHILSTDNYRHYEHRKEDSIPWGCQYFKWTYNPHQEGTVRHYLVETGHVIDAHNGIPMQVKETIWGNRPKYWLKREKYSY